MINNSISTSDGSSKVVENKAKYIIVRINEEKIMIPFTVIKNINRSMESFAVPKVNNYTKGAVMYNGRAIPFIDLLCLLNCHNTQRGDQDCMAVCYINNSYVGILVNQILGIEEIADSDIVKPDKNLHDISKNYIKGYYKKADYISLNLIDIFE